MTWWPSIRASAPRRASSCDRPEPGLEQVLGDHRASRRPPRCRSGRTAAGRSGTRGRAASRRRPSAAGPSDRRPGTRRSVTVTVDPAPVEQRRARSAGARPRPPTHLHVPAGRRRREGPACRRRCGRGRRRAPSAWSASTPSIYDGATCRPRSMWAPIETSISAMSTISGSRAAFSMRVVPAWRAPRPSGRSRSRRRSGSPAGCWRRGARWGPPRRGSRGSRGPSRRGPRARPRAGRARASRWRHRRARRRPPHRRARRAGRGRRSRPAARAPARSRPGARCSLGDVDLDDAGRRVVSRPSQPSRRSSSAMIVTSTMFGTLVSVVRPTASTCHGHQLERAVLGADDADRRPEAGAADDPEPFPHPPT